MLQDSMNSWKVFSVSCWVWKCFPCKKLSRCLKKWSGEYGRWVKTSLPIHSMFEMSCNMWPGIVMQKNQALSADQCHLQVLLLSVHLIHLQSIFLRCNGFSRIQKAIVDQTGSKPPNSNHDLFLVQVWLWKVLWSFFSVQPLSWPLMIVI